MKKYFAIMLALVMMMSINVPTMAASKKYNAAVKSYKKYASANAKGKPAYWSTTVKSKYKIVDLDGNGIPELLIENWKKCKNEVYSYNYTKKKMVLLKSVGIGGNTNSSITYSKSKKAFCFIFAKNYQERTYYKVSGTKAKKLIMFSYSPFENNFKGAYYVNNKKVSKSTYNKKLKTYSKFSGL